MASKVEVQDSKGETFAVEPHGPAWSIRKADTKWTPWQVGRLARANDAAPDVWMRAGDWWCYRTRTEARAFLDRLAAQHPDTYARPAMVKGSSDARVDFEAMRAMVGR